MKLTGAFSILKALEIEGVEVVFGYPGAAICPFYDALLETPILHVLTRHEQGAVHAASGYARVSGKTGVCISTSGPGATNLITGIATAYMDSIPIVAITGQVPTDQVGKDVFQEADITGATAPFCKHSYLVKDAKKLPRIIKEAFHIASTGRPGPVVIDIPIDIQEAEIEFNYPETVDIKGYKPTYRGHSVQIKKAADAILKAKSPLICAGGGVISSDASDVLVQLAEKTSIPVVTTLMGKGAIPHDHPLYLGMLGSHGVHTANFAVSNADLLLVLGARVGDRAMGSAAQMAKKAKIIHIDIDPAEIGKNIHAAIPIVGDVGLVLKDILEVVQKPDIAKWLLQLHEVSEKRKIKENTKINENDFVKPSYFIKQLGSKLNKKDILTTEVGQNQIWAANNFKTSLPRTFISSGGMGTMGYGIPAAVGARIAASKDKRVVAIAGDGSFQMSMQELGTIKQFELEIKVIIFNNSRLGMVRELQKNKYSSRYSQVVLDSNPDFIKIFEAYGFSGLRIKNNSEVEEGIEKMLNTKGTFLLECLVDPFEPTLC